MMGLGFNHTSVALSYTGASSTSKGVFTSTNKNPILLMTDQKTDIAPPPYNKFVFTGQLLSENPTTSSVISQMYENSMKNYKNSGNPFHCSNNTSPALSNHFDSEKAKSNLKHVMIEQDRGKLF